jgi:hypothetical protein
MKKNNCLRDGKLSFNKNFFFRRTPKQKKNNPSPHAPRTHCPATVATTSSKQGQLIPAQLKHIIQKEGKVKDLATCLKNIEQAKKNELHSYLSLCEIRVGLLPSDLTSKPPV